jgi:hypothetical protein
MIKYSKDHIPVHQIEYFFCTGKDRKGKKFRIQNQDLWYINCINAYSHKITWAKLKNGQRIKLY